MLANCKVESWNRLLEFLSQICPVSDQNDWSITLGEAAQLRLIRVATSEPTFASRELAAVHAWVAPSGSFEPSWALELSAKLPMGAIVERSNGFELRQVVDLANTTFGELDRLAGYLGQLGVALRKRSLKTATPELGAVFDIYAEVE